MNTHKNAPLTPKGREAMTRSGPRQVDLGFELVLRDSG